MSDSDPGKLADELEHEAAQMQEQSEKLHGDVAEVREDWERKRRDQNVPGAPEPTGESTEEEEHSPAPQAPPETESPAAAETPPEGAVGPPKDQLEH